MSIFGTLVGQPEVEQAVVDTVNVWIHTYLAEVERQHDLKHKTLTRPPNSESVYGCLDFDRWEQDNMPSVIVVANPTGETELNSVGYGQAYEVQVGARVIKQDEATARLIAGHYGTAIMGLIVQNGSLGGIAVRTRLTVAPVLSLPDPDDRTNVLCVTTFHVFVQPITSDQDGPDVPTPPDSPQYGGTPEAPFADWPTVETTDLSVTAEPISS